MIVMVSSLYTFSLSLLLTYYVGLISAKEYVINKWEFNMFTSFSRVKNIINNSLKNDFYYLDINTYE